MNEISVWKYPFETTDRFVLAMPAGAKPLCVQVQNGQPCLWAMVDPELPRVERHFAVSGTGHPFRVDGFEYVGTYQLLDGRFVGHLWAGPWEKESQDEQS